jgi:hypothetical protein
LNHHGPGAGDGSRLKRRIDMLKNDIPFCDRCKEEVSERPHVTLMQDFDNLPDEILNDYIDLCQGCWTQTKQFLNVE